jgi:hypothetical protein
MARKKTADSKVETKTKAAKNVTHKSAVTGRIVSAEDAAKSPDTTYAVKRAKKVAPPKPVECLTIGRFYEVSGTAGGSTIYGECVCEGGVQVWSGGKPTNTVATVCEPQTVREISREEAYEFSVIQSAQ